MAPKRGTSAATQERSIDFPVPEIPSIDPAELEIALRVIAATADLDPEDPDYIALRLSLIHI